ncbi:transposase [Candidatus Magnetoovum chiemensis]|nr:transposase [Candidatus Magnetoovum chiemensis]
MEELKRAISKFPDIRTGKNKMYTMEEVALGAFSVFFTQSPSFLAHQQAMKKLHDNSNAETLFSIKHIPSDNHIREMLDEVSPEVLYSVFDVYRERLKKDGILHRFRSINNSYLIAIDGTWYYESKTVHCGKCLKMNHRNMTITYYHSMICPVILRPCSDKVISLRPEFIRQQDGNTKQDCEMEAAKRWIISDSEKLGMNITFLGDDLYSKEPLCSMLLERRLNFIFVCKPESHKTLYEWVSGLDKDTGLYTFENRHRKGRNILSYRYKYANRIPLRDRDDSLKVNWVELEVTSKEGKRVYKNGFITNYEINSENVEEIVEAGRSRWKIENENNNVLKTKGYHLEHNYGHGSKNLSFVLITLNLLAFQWHTILDFVDKRYDVIRKELSSRHTFFDDLRALTRYICFGSWTSLMNFMLDGLKLKVDTS